MSSGIGRRPFLKAAAGTAAVLALPGRLVSLSRGWPPRPARRPDRYPPIVPGFPHMLHGGDWNPDQWLHEPGVHRRGLPADGEVRVQHVLGRHLRVGDARAGRGRVPRSSGSTTS